MPKIDPYDKGSKEVYHKYDSGSKICISWYFGIV